MPILQTTFTTDDACRHAVEFCRAHTTWKPIFELDDESLYSPIPWDDLPGWVKKPWRSRYRNCARDAYEEFATDKPHRFRSGHVSGAGVFYRDCLAVPRFHNSCMVFEVGGRPGFYCLDGERDPKNGLLI